uniref:NADH dehydrogenase [ubiquinone] 1 beta subcomplex subunit 4 n=1 Tax=Romanomermis culicivorax TaxID=13658 RepID=A0A915ITE9_ROMCU
MNIIRISTRACKHHTRAPICAEKGGLWQDPLLGYFETHGKMEFKKGEEYDMTEDQKKAIMERYKRKETLKRQYLEQEFNPLQYRYMESVIIDPAVFRWYAANMNTLERFRYTPKTILATWGGMVLFIYLMYRFVRGDEVTFEDLCESGEYLWWDRKLRMGNVGGTGP